MVEPTGVPARTEATMPTKAQLTDNTAEQMVTARKFLHRRIAERAGKITSAEISREPTRFIASTMMTAMTMAISRLYPFALVPTACAKSSSNWAIIKPLISRKEGMQMELFRRTLAGLLMLVVAVSVGIWVQGKFIDAVRLPTHTRMIGATYTTLSDPFYETINDEIQMQIKSNGDLLLVRDPGQDQERQNQEIEDMLNKGIELLIVNPVDYVGVTPALEKAREKGVPVILIDSKVDDPELVTCTITSNNYGAGLLDARHLISQTKSARIVLLSNSDSFSSWDRLSGFCQTLTKSGNDYRILELRDCGGELNRAMRAMVQLLETFPRIDVVMAVNEQAALGAMAALEEKGVLSSTLVYSVDGSPEAKALISEGLMTATSAQSPLRIGRMAAEAVYEILEGKPYLTNIVVPVNQITQEDILRYGTEGWQ